MKRAITVLAVLVLFFVTTSANFATPSSKFIIEQSSSSNRNTISLTSSTLNSSFSSSFTSQLTYVRVFKDGKWWIYVYDGSKLVDVYPE